MRYAELLFEYSRASLFHATKVTHAIDILQENAIFSFTSQNIRNFTTSSDRNNYGKIQSKVVDGVSLTRSKSFAISWNDVVFELDQDQLRNNFKFVPFNWFYSGRVYHYTMRQEAEEFLIGPILNVDKYIKAILISEFVIKTSVANLKRSKPNSVDILMNHPKLKIRPATNYEKSALAAATT